MELFSEANPGNGDRSRTEKREDREEIMQEVSVIIPNFNGMAYLDGVLAGLECQTVSNFDVILVDNGSNDGSCAFVAARYPWVHLIELPENFGFCKAVNEGIRASRSPYVLLLNNDIEVTENFIEEMLSAIKRHPKAFSCAARMIQFHDRDRLVLSKHTLGNGHAADVVYAAAGDAVQIREGGHEMEPVASIRCQRGGKLCPDIPAQRGICLFIDASDLFFLCPAHQAVDRIICLRRRKVACLGIHHEHLCLRVCLQHSPTHPASFPAYTEGSPCSHNTYNPANPSC